MSFAGRPPECEEREQAAAYVLHALEGGEAEHYREHLEHCALCSADVASLQPVADLLLADVPHVPASPELGERIMASVRPEAELLKAAGAKADRPQSGRLGRRIRRPQLLVGAVAMGVGLLIGAIVINTGSRAPGTRVVTAQVASGSSSARASLREVGEHAELVVSGMSQPPRGKIYEIWLARAGADPQATNALFGVTRGGGDASVDVPGNLAGVHQVMVTAEPLGGSAHPTSSPIIVATLRSS